MSRAKEAFSRFYKTPVKIFRIKHGSSYQKEAQTERVCSVLADLQPYGGGMEEKQFGLEVKRGLKMYCGDCSEITEGGYAEADGRKYRIISVERRNMGIVAVLEGSEQD